MSSNIVTSEDVFSESDPLHPCATITRVGGGAYAVVSFLHGRIHNQETADTIAKARKVAKAHADAIDSTPTEAHEKIALAATIRDQAAELEDVRRQHQADVASLQAIIQQQVVALADLQSPQAPEG